MSAKATDRVANMIKSGIFGMIMLMAVSASAGENLKVSELNQKIADMSLLQHQLTDRSTQVASIRKGLIDQKNNLRAEIAILAKSLKIIAYTDALEQLRIRYNLELLQAIYGYLAELDTKALFYDKGRSKLQYLQQSAQDDIKMIATINDLKIEALVTQISLVINQYLPDAHVIQINSDNIAMPSTQTIWEEITTGRH